MGRGTRRTVASATLPFQCELVKEEVEREVERASRPVQAVEGWMHRHASLDSSASGGDVCVGAEGVHRVDVEHVHAREERWRRAVAHES